MSAQSIRVTSLTSRTSFTVNGARARMGIDGKFYFSVELAEIGNTLKISAGGFPVESDQIAGSIVVDGGETEMYVVSERNGKYALNGRPVFDSLSIERV